MPRKKQIRSKGYQFKLEPVVQFTEDREPWDHYPEQEEREKDYECFLIYRDLAYPDGHDGEPRHSQRTLRRAWEVAADRGIWSTTESQRESLTTHAPTWRLSKRFRWKERAAAFDRRIEQIRWEERRKTIRQNERELAELGRRMLQLNRLETEKLLGLSAEDVRQGRKTPRMSPKDLAAITRAVLGVVRAGEGRAPEAVEVSHSGKTYAELIREAARAAEKNED